MLDGVGREYGFGRPHFVLLVAEVDGTTYNICFGMDREGLHIERDGIGV